MVKITQAITNLNTLPMRDKSIITAIARQEAEKSLGLYNHAESFTTADATPTTALVVEIPEYSAGFIEVEVAALLEDGTAKFSAKWIVGIHKTTTLTIDTEDVLHTQNGIAGASFTVIDDSDNPAIEITGVAATSIVWAVRTREFILNIIPVAP